MSLTRSLAAAAAAAIALNAAAVSAADMETTNAMPSSFGGTCKKQACKQGVLFADSISFNDEFDAPTFSYAIGADLGGAGWAAGPVTDDDTWDVYEYDDWICQLKLRGVTILRMMNAMVGSNVLTGNNDAATDAPLLQYNNVRVKYSTTLPATSRLLSVEVKDPATGEYKPIDRTALYTVNSLEYDYEFYEPYDTWTASPSLTGEGVECGDIEFLQGELAENFLKAKSPYTIPDVSQALASQADGTAMVVEQDAAMCKAMTPPHKYDAGLESCVPCPPGSTSTGTECEAVATAAPVTPAPVTPAPVTPVPVTPVPVTPAPGATPTGAPAVPSESATGAPASSPSASSAAGGTGAATAAPDAPTPAPANTGTGTAAGAAGGAAAPSSGASMGLIIGIVVGVVALIAVAAIVGFVVMRNRQSGSTNAADGLDSRLEPADGDQLIGDTEKDRAGADEAI